MKIEDVPSFDSPRVTEDIDYDPSDGRHQMHRKKLLIDGVVVYSKVWYEDDDWDSCSQEQPSLYDMYKKYLKSLQA